MNEKYNNGVPMNMTVVSSNNGAGKTVIGGPVTSSQYREGSPTLLLNHIEQRVVRVAPNVAPLDQILRHTDRVVSGSQVVDFYMSDEPNGKAKITSLTALTGSQAYHDGKPCYKLATDNNDAFDVDDTILVIGRAGEHDAGEIEMTRKSLVLYVESRTADGTGFNVVAVNAAIDKNGDPQTGGLEGNEVAKMGRALSELAVTTGQIQTMPVKATNYCQRFKQQAEVSNTAVRTAKEIEWSFAEMERDATFILRSTMERSLLFGTKARLSNRRSGNETLLTEGLWSQTRPFYVIEETDSLLSGIMAAAFTGNAASECPWRIMLAGSNLMTKLSALLPLEASNIVSRWGLTFRVIATQIGVLYVTYDPAFDECGHGDDGLVIDLSAVTKYVFEPFNIKDIDLSETGERDSSARILSETCCVVLRNPYGCLRVLG